MKKTIYLMMTLLLGAVMFTACGGGDDGVNGNDPYTPGGNGGGDNNPLDPNSSNVVGMWLMTDMNGTEKITHPDGTITTEQLNASTTPMMISLQADNTIKYYEKKDGQWKEIQSNETYIVSNGCIVFTYHNSDGSSTTGQSYQITELTSNTMKWYSYTLSEGNGYKNEVSWNIYFTRVASFEAADALLNKPVTPTVGNHQLVVGDYKVSLPYAFFINGEYNKGVYENAIYFSSIDMSNPAAVSPNTKFSVMMMILTSKTPFDVNSIPTGTNYHRLDITINQDAGGKTREAAFESRNNSVKANITKSGNNYTFVINNQMVNTVDAQDHVVEGSYANLSFNYSGAVSFLNADTRQYKSAFQQMNDSYRAYKNIQQMKQERIFPLRH